MEEKKDFSINIRPEIATGKYSNLAVLSHSKNEFILDFAAMLPGIPQTEVVSRILMCPEHAKRLLLALQDNVAKYENSFGKISLGETPAFNMNGNGTKS